VVRAYLWSQREDEVARLLKLQASMEGEISSLKLELSSEQDKVEKLKETVLASEATDVSNDNAEREKLDELQKLADLRDNLLRESVRLAKAFFKKVM